MIFIALVVFPVVLTGFLGVYLAIRSARREASKRYVVFHVTTEDGNSHEVAAHDWISWVALRSLEGRGLPSQSDMRFMFRHMDDGAVDKAIYDLLRDALPRVKRAAVKGGIDLNEN